MRGRGPCEGPTETSPVAAVCAAAGWVGCIPPGCEAGDGAVLAAGPVSVKEDRVFRGVMTESDERRGDGSTRLHSSAGWPTGASSCRGPRPPGREDERFRVGA